MKGIWSANVMPDSHLLASALLLRCVCASTAHCVNMNEVSEVRVKQH